MHSQIWAAFVVGVIIGAATMTILVAVILERNSRRNGG